VGATLKTFVMESGERYCLLVDEQTSLPLYYPNLYITTQVRNNSLSYSAMETALAGIAVLLKYFEDMGQSIETRFQKGNFLQTYELDALRDYCQNNFRSKVDESKSSVVSLFGFELYDYKVSTETEYTRLTTIARYTKWLANQLGGVNKDKTITKLIEEMYQGLKARRPKKKNRNPENSDKGLTKDQVELLFELFRLESDLNPFIDKGVRRRNRLIFLLLYHLGIRGGELLNIKISDIDFSHNQIIIARRADDKSDPRKHQPLVKTLDRRLPVRDTLIKELHDYITKDRKKIPNASKNEFLLITHKPGKTQGQPLSISAYKKILNIVRLVSPVLFNLTGHQLRHRWNEDFSERMDKMDEPHSPEVQEKLRSYLMGWREGSGTSATYNQRFIKKKAHEAALKLQEGMFSKEI
jgi:integrase